MSGSPRDTERTLQERSMTAQRSSIHDPIFKGSDTVIMSRWKAGIMQHYNADAIRARTPVRCTTLLSWRCFFHNRLRLLLKLAFSLAVFSVIFGLYDVYELSVTCSDFDVEQLQGSRNVQREKYARASWSMVLNSECVWKGEYYSKTFIRYLIIGVGYSIQLLTVPKPGITRVIFKRASLCCHLAFWIIQLVTWHLQIMAPEFVNTILLLLLPQFFCLAFVIVQRDGTKVPVIVEGAFALLSALLVFGLRLSLGPILRYKTSFVYTLFLCLFPIFLAVVQLFLLWMVSRLKLREIYHRGALQVFLFKSVLVLESLRYGIILFSYNEETSTAILISILVNCFIEIAIRFPELGNLLVSSVKKKYQTKSAASSSGSYIPPESCSRIGLIKMKLEATYWPLTVSLLVNSYGWMPFSGVGSIRDRYGKPTSIQSAPAWFFLVITLSYMIVDLVTVILLRVFKAPSPVMTLKSSVLTTSAYHLFALAFSFVYLGVLTYPFVRETISAE